MATKKVASKKKAPSRPKTRAAARRPESSALPQSPPTASKPAGASWTVKIVMAAIIVAALLSFMVFSRHSTAPSVPVPAPVPTAAPAPTVVAEAPHLPAIQEEGPKLGEAAHRRHKKTARPAPRAGKPKVAAQTKPAPGGDEERGVSLGHPLKLRAWRDDNATATLDIFGAHNKLLAHIESPAGPAGWQTLSWDGRDDQGKKSRPGLVYVRASVPGLQDIQRIRIR